MTRYGDIVRAINRIANFTRLYRTSCRLFIFPCAGKVGMSPLYLYARVRFSTHCTRDRGCSGARLSLRPLVRGGQRDAKLGRNRAAGSPGVRRDDSGGWRNSALAPHSTGITSTSTRSFCLREPTMMPSTGETSEKSRPVASTM